jgi:hypothetical protein
MGVSKSESGERVTMKLELEESKVGNNEGDDCAKAGRLEEREEKKSSRRRGRV